MKKILFLAALSTLTAACGDCDNETEGPDEIRIRSLIADIAPTQDGTRTAYSGSTVSWADGDAIGLFCPQSSTPAVNTQFTVAGTGSTPSWTTLTPVYWTNGTTLHTVTAYYPYSSGNTSAAAVKLPAISTQTGAISPALDFLISNNNATTGVLRSAGPVSLIFTHALSLVEFKVVLGTGMTTGTTLTNFTFAGSAADKVYSSDATSTIALATGVITPGAATSTATMTPATAPTLSTTPHSVYALILPGTFTAPTLAMTLSEGGTPISIPAAPVATTTFAPATKYSYTVTINRNAITLSNPTITDWTTVNGNAITPTF